MAMRHLTRLYLPGVYGVENVLQSAVQAFLRRSQVEGEQSQRC